MTVTTTLFFIFIFHWFPFRFDISFFLFFFFLKPIRVQQKQKERKKEHIRTKKSVVSMGRHHPHHHGHPTPRETELSKAGEKPYDVEGSSRRQPSEEEFWRSDSPLDHSERPIQKHQKATTEVQAEGKKRKQKRHQTEDDADEGRGASSLRGAASSSASLAASSLPKMEANPIASEASHQKGTTPCLPSSSPRAGGEVSLRTIWARSENKRCGDCREVGTEWVSVNLGVFLCVSCAGVHRSLGTHLSRVKSITMDAWSPVEVALLQHLGNAVAAELFEATMPKAVQCTPVYTIDERRTRIHAKYVSRAFAGPDAWRILNRVYREVGYGKYASLAKGEGGRGERRRGVGQQEEEEKHGRPRRPDAVQHTDKEGEAKKQNGVKSRRSGSLDSVGSEPHPAPLSKAQQKQKCTDALKALYGVVDEWIPEEERRKRNVTSNDKEEDPQHTTKKREKSPLPFTDTEDRDATGRNADTWRTSSDRHPDPSLPDEEVPREREANASLATSCPSIPSQRVMNERGVFGVLNVPKAVRAERLALIHTYFHIPLNSP